MLVLILGRGNDCTEEWCALVDKRRMDKLLKASLRTYICTLVVTFNALLATDFHDVVTEISYTTRDGAKNFCLAVQKFRMSGLPRDSPLPPPVAGYARLSQVPQVAAVAHDRETRNKATRPV